MKNQYLGDNRDLFKYDLILNIIQAGLVNHFTFIPMLTEPDNTKQGGERNPNKAKAGRKNDKLVKFLDKFEKKSKRDIKHLGNFFRKQGIEMTIYYGKNKYFSHIQREEYFEQMGEKLLSKSLVFVDPDIGLGSERSKEKHILYSEVKSLYERMDKSSILMIFQFIPRKNRESYYTEISKKLKEKVGNLPIYISDNQIMFFFLTKDESLRKSLTKVISDYVESYSGLRVGNA